MIGFALTSGVGLGGQMRSFRAIIAGLCCVALASCGSTNGTASPATTMTSAPSSTKSSPTRTTAATTRTTTSSSVPTSSAAPKPATFSLTCKVGNSYSVPFASYQDAWASNPPTESCEAKRSGTEYSDLQRAAVAAAGYSSMDSLKSLYGLCGAVDGFYTKQIVSDSQAQEATGMLMLCPDHPKAAQIQANIGQRTAASAAVSSANQAVQDGTYAKEGKHLVGSEIQPGTWQSVGAKVEDCYWEVSDVSGNIIDNNFISVAPQFTITIPSDAAGFTNQGCEFERISD